MAESKKRQANYLSFLEAPQVGLEPTTLRLTAACSAIELLRNAACGIIAKQGVVSSKSYGR